MNFTTQIVINRPRDRVVELMRNPDNIAKWQPGLQTVELLSGEKDQVGARSRIVVDARGFRLELIETIVEHNPPERFASLFEARGVRNFVENRFIADGPDATRWVMANSFKFTGFMSLAGLFLRDFVPRQSLESMSRFKDFAESS